MFEELGMVWKPLQRCMGKEKVDGSVTGKGLNFSQPKLQSWSGVDGCFLQHRLRSIESHRFFRAQGLMESSCEVACPTAQIDDCHVLLDVDELEKVGERLFPFVLELFILTGIPGRHAVLLDCSYWAHCSDLSTAVSVIAAMKELLCLLNGITDVPLSDLGGLTPLQKAYHPVLDRVASQSRCLLGLPPDEGGVESGLLSLLGVNETVPLGALEAMAVGRSLSADESVFSVRLVGLGAETVVDVSDALVSDQEGAALCRELEDLLAERSVQLCHLWGPRAILIGPRSLAENVRTTPLMSPAAAVGNAWQTLLPEENRDLRSVAELIIEKLTQSEINVVKRELGEQEANGIWFYGGGRGKAALQKAQAPGLLLATTLEAVGVGTFAGWRVERAPATLSEMSQCVMTQLDSHERVVLEVCHLMDSTYKGDLLQKVKRIEWLDKHLIGPLVEVVERKKARLTVLAAKHCDIRLGSAVAGPVPVIRYPGQGGRSRLDEITFADAPQVSFTNLLADQDLQQVVPHLPPVR